METGTQSGWCHSGSRQPWRRRDRVHPVQHFEVKTQLKEIILTKNANGTFADVELSGDFGGRSKNTSEVEEW